jgi:hypothetical protein
LTQIIPNFLHNIHHKQLSCFSSYISSIHFSKLYGIQPLSCFSSNIKVIHFSKLYELCNITYIFYPLFSSNKSNE